MKPTPLELDLLTAVARIRQLRDTGYDFLLDRLVECDVPRLLSYVHPLAQEWAEITPAPARDGRVTDHEGSVLEVRAETWRNDDGTLRTVMTMWDDDNAKYVSQTTVMTPDDAEQIGQRFVNAGDEIIGDATMHVLPDDAEGAE